MKLKIFNTALLSLACFLAVSKAGFSQQSSGSTLPPPAPQAIVPGLNQNLDDKDYHKKMQKLQEQMHELQKQMKDLNREKFKKQALAMAELSKKWTDSGQTMVFKMNDKFKNFYFDRSNFNDHFNFNYNTQDDKWLKEKIQSGEIKEKTKSYSKSYPADKNDVLKIENKFGKVSVNTWNKNEFKVEVQVKTYANEESDAQKFLDNINIEDHKEGDVVSFKTIINNTTGNNSWGLWKSEGKTRIRKMEINYTVYMPAKNSVDISNSFGSTELPDLDGKVILHSSYGSLVAKTLTNSSNEINVKYGSANIQELRGSDLDVAYGSLILGTGEKLNADVSYSSAKIGRIRNSAVINAKYAGGFEIAGVDRDVKNLSVNCQYSSLKVGLPENTDADFDVTVHYGSFNYYNLPVNILVKTPDDQRGFTATKNYKGHLGKGNSDKLITIKSTFGSVKFEQ